MLGSLALAIGPPTTVLIPRALQRVITFFMEGPCTIMPLKKTTSAHLSSASSRERTFKSTARFCHVGGRREATVSKPRGGYAERLPGKGSACLKLQNVSGNS